MSNRCLAEQITQLKRFRRAEAQHFVWCNAHLRRSIVQAVPVVGICHIVPIVIFISDEPLIVASAA